MDCGEVRISIKKVPTVTMTIEILMAAKTLTMIMVVGRIMAEMTMALRMTTTSLTTDDDDGYVDDDVDGDDDDDMDDADDEPVCPYDTPDCSQMRSKTNQAVPTCCQDTHATSRMTSGHSRLLP